MSSQSNNKGRGYEFTWINTLDETINKTKSANITFNSSYFANKNAWEALDDKTREILKVSANAAIDTLFELEPNLWAQSSDISKLTFQSDDKGVKGDVRDIVISRTNPNWQIGLSIKHNHDAVKHSRLSPTIDFSKNWYGVPCDVIYKQEVAPVFEMLKTYQKRRVKWSEMKNKAEEVYLPLLNSFIGQIKRNYAENRKIIHSLFLYLLGTFDYYKIISLDNKRCTLIKPFNMRGDLNKPFKDVKPGISINILELPDELIELRIKPNSSNTVEMFLNKGWQLSFRLHNASTYVEPSLKFDIRFLGMPPSALSFECLWDR